jgi:eukaryotic-like serine/threonine-protein kinase
MIPSSLKGRFFVNSFPKINFMLPHPPNLIGATVENRFEILSMVGEGGMASVYKARRRQSGDLVAIKVLKRHEHFSYTDIERMKREARALRSLFHPNIVRAHSFGFLESGEPYLVLDFLKGKSLDDYICSGETLSIEWVLEVLIQICGGLACAHEIGLIHRDLKPSNVMIIDPPEDGAFVKLLDFGTAKFTAPEPQDLALTQKGIIFGSPFYISPEQISGMSFDERTDIYSLGCLMYETITGRLPYVGKNQMDTLMKHLHEEPPPFSQVVTGRVIPVEIEAIVLRCMEKDPEARFQYVFEVEQALLTGLENFRQGC